MLLFLGFNTSARYATIIGEKKKKKKKKLSPFCWVFYCFGCHIFPLIIRFSKLPILHSPLSSISGQCDIQKHMTFSAQKTTFKSAVLKSHAYNRTLRL